MTSPPGRGLRRGRLALLTCLASVGLLAGVIQAAAASPQHAASSAAQSSAADLSRCTATYLQSQLNITGLAVDSASLNISGTFTAPFQPPISGLPAFCDVTLTQTDSAGNPIHIDVWLPSTWNGRFQGVGGAVFECGPIYFETAAAIRGGYASAATDCGVNPADLLTGSWALNPDGTLNWPLINDFSSIGIHDMSVAGEAVTRIYFTSPLAYTYFNGCSTGGREGLMEAQRYPADYNGIVSGSPAINWTKFIPSEIWPELVMKESNDYLPSCKEQAFTDAAMAACADGSGVIENPAACQWNPSRLVGDVTPCGTITAQDATVMTRIWDGPIIDGKHLWYGLEPGTSLTGLASTTTTNGVTTGNAFPIAQFWLGTWLLQNPNWDWHTLTYAQFDSLFAQSVSEYAQAIATDNPDLSAFEHDGGKILIWHGLADQLIFPQGTINYYQRVQDTLGAANAATFARLFVAPGAAHCGPAAGPAPANPLQDVVNWVENGKAPSTILATGGVDPSGQPTQRQLCAYPYLSEYLSGDPTSLSSYSCVLLTPGQQRQLTALHPGLS